LFFFPTAFLLLAVIFSMGRLTGDPVTISMGGRLNSAELDELRSRYGYDQPVVEQFLNYLSNLFRGNLGTSFQSGLPVADVIADHLPGTVELGIFGSLLGLLVAIPLGVVVASRAGGFFDALVRSWAVVTYALPVFLLALLLRLVFSVWLPIFPTSGRLDPVSQIQFQLMDTSTGFYTLDSIISGNWGLLSSTLGHLVLPGFTIAVVIGATMMRIIRSNVIIASKTEAILFARSLGLKSRSINRWHIGKLVLPEVLTSYGYAFAGIISGVVFVEVSFELRGLGWLLAQSVVNRDFELLQGLVVFFALIIVAVNLSVDALLIIFDRRFRKAEAR
jgi:peptide/nickel transport system permease protein